MKEKIRIGFVGCGQFCRHFVPLFKKHPAVEFIGVTDKFPDRCIEYDRLFQVDKIYDSFDHMLASEEVNSIAIFSQRNQHGQMAIAALQAGKNVYSAVPMATSIDEIRQIVELVRQTGLAYSLGETGHYRPATIFCRQKFASGEMGDFVYAEAQYNHDMKHLYNTFKYTEGDQWRKMAGLPPMYYPTHSTSMVLSAAGTYATKVAAFGYEDHQDTDIFGAGKNYWDNPFSNTSMLLKLANGGIACISENRRIAWNCPPTYISCFYGTAASYECSIAQHTYVRMPGEKVLFEDVSELLNPVEMTAHRSDPDFFQKVVNGGWGNSEAPIQSQDRIPKELHSLPSAHSGTHKYMVDDFCRACISGKLSPTNAWQAARYNLPGLVAHESAKQNGVALEIPDLGNPPEDWEVLPSEYAATKSAMPQPAKTSQLVMRYPDTAKLPSIVLPDGYAIHTERKDSIPAWESIVESSFGKPAFYSDKIITRPGYCPERVYFVSIEGKDVATATSYNHKDYPGEGFLHMVATHREAMRKGAGKLVTLAVLHGLKDFGMTSCVLTTDDFRLPAIKMYLSIGFMPVIENEHMKERWRKVMEQLNQESGKRIGDA
jgi:predicted dehydrogenase